MKQRMTNMWIVTLVGFLVLALTACFENDTKTLKDYKNLRDSGVLENVEKGRNQTFYSRDSYRIEVVPQQALQFEVGEPSEYKISAVLYFENSRIDLIGENMPTGATLTRSIDPEEENIWIFKWQPPGGFVPSGKTVSSWPLTFRIDVVDAGSPENEEYVYGVDFSSDFTLEIHRSGKAPEVDLVPELPAEIREGDLVPLTVEALIPGTAAGDNVRVEFSPMNKSDVFNFAGYLSLTDTPEFLGDSRWRFQFALDFKNKRLPQPGSPAQATEGLFGEAALRVIAPTGRQSEPVLLQAQVLYQLPAPTPELSWGDATYAVKGGAGTIIPPALIAMIPAGSGEVWFDEDLLEQEFKKWPGEVKFTCGLEDGKQHKAKCSITWTPPCVSKEWTMTIHAHSKRGDSGEMIVLKKNIRVNPDEAACQTGEAP